METKKVVICSDVHLCHINWYGMSSRDRMEKLIDDLNALYEKEPYEEVIFLGDYSLDFWQWDIGGSFVQRGVSNTENFIRDYASRLRAPYHMHPGNHEQYGYEKWRALTGTERDDCLVTGGYLFVFSDNFSGILDPDFNSDGQYTPTKLDFVRRCMESFPSLPVILCSHFFSTELEPSEFFEFIKKEKRIVALFCGHDHVCRTEDLGERADRVCIYHDGHYSYHGSGSPLDLMWGFCLLGLSGEGVRARYVEPYSRFEFGGKIYEHPASEKNAAFFKRRDI